MNRYLKLLNSQNMTLIMSLPANAPALCRAAFEESADVVKVHNQCCREQAFACSLFCCISTP